MGVDRVWSIFVVLLCFHGGTDSQTDIMTSLEVNTIDVTVTMGTPPPTLVTPPPPPPPSPPPPPPTSVTPQPTPEPPTTRPPPPPPPPSPPPPPPSTIMPPSTTPAPPTGLPTTMPTVRFTTTVAIEPTRKITEPPVEPNPIAEDLGKIGVILNVPLAEFNEQSFRETIAREVNNYCAENPCKGEGKTVTSEDVVIVSTEEYNGVLQVLDSRRRLLQSEQTLVEYYVRDPTSSSNVMMTTEEQMAFLADETVQAALEDDIGLVGIAPDYAEPVVQEGLEGWEIALIVIGSVAGAALIIVFIVYLNKDQKKSGDLDVELQDKKDAAPEKAENDYHIAAGLVVANAAATDEKKKLPVNESNVSTQVKYNEILAATGYVPGDNGGSKMKGEPAVGVDEVDTAVEAKPNGNAIVVTAEITSSSSSEQDETENLPDSPPPIYQKVVEADNATNDDADAKRATEEADAFGELDDLVADQTESDESAAYENAAFTANTETDKDGISKTAL